MLPLVAIVGPTASGKSAAAMALAASLSGEIVSCDSVQVYRYFNVGTAKPTADDRRCVPHHLIDVADPNESFDAQRYIDLARAAIADIRARGKIPILCGGTGLYLRALRYGLAQAPAVDPDLRRALMAEENTKPGALYARLLELDPVSAARLERNNHAHVLRTLEICLQAGEPASVLRARHGFRVPIVPMHVIALSWPDAALQARIAARTQYMLQAGLLDEVCTLLRRGVDERCRAMRAVGYREALLVQKNQALETDLYAAIVKSTWQYVRRQRTWLRRENAVTFMQVETLPAAIERLQELAINFLNT